MIEFKCPKCGEAMSVPSSRALLADQCPECGETVGVPDAPKRKPPPPRDPGYSFHTKVAGISQYQKEATRCRVGDILRLVREPDNEHDENAIAVHRDNSAAASIGNGSFLSSIPKLFTCGGSDDQIGYINADLAEDLAEQMDDGIPVNAVVSDLTGGTRHKPTFGINIQITVGPELRRARRRRPSAPTAQAPSPPQQVIVKAKEGLFLQTMNVGCAIVLIIVAFVIIAGVIGTCLAV